MATGGDTEVRAMVAWVGLADWLAGLLVKVLGLATDLQHVVVHVDELQFVMGVA